MHIILFTSATFAIVNTVQSPEQGSDESVGHAVKVPVSLCALSFPEYAVIGSEGTAVKVTVSLKALVM